MTIMTFPNFWTNLFLNEFFNPPKPEDYVAADLEGVSIKQYVFNSWMQHLEKTGDGFDHCYNPVKLSRLKCWFWWAVPGWFLGVDDRMRFKGWNIGQCLNCSADPYDGVVESWSYDHGWFRGVLIRCNKCGQLRWQVGKNGSDY